MQEDSDSDGNLEHGVIAAATIATPVEAVEDSASSCQDSHDAEESASSFEDSDEEEGEESSGDSCDSESEVESEANTVYEEEEWEDSEEDTDEEDVERMAPIMRMQTRGAVRRLGL